MSAKSNETVFQLKITLRDSKPPIWRRVIVPAKFSLYKLHQIIQTAIGWTDSHLHQFIIHGDYYGIPSREDWEPVIDERRHTLNEIVSDGARKFIYEYDFGDSWEHEIIVEKTLSPEAGMKYPVCIKGKRACPPEDIGGMWGYDDFLEAINDPNHEEHEEFLEWVGREFDPEEFDMEMVNLELRKVK